MENVQIIELHNGMLSEVRSFLSDIYPDDAGIIEKLVYKKEKTDHLLTVFAKSSEKLIGQSNIFHKEIFGGIANIGFHVHPDFRCQGVATRLAAKAMKMAKTKGHENFYIITENENIAARTVAEKLRFTLEPNQSIDRYTIYKKSI